MSVLCIRPVWSAFSRNSYTLSRKSVHKIEAAGSKAEIGGVSFVGRIKHILVRIVGSRPTMSIGRGRSREVIETWPLMQRPPDVKLARYQINKLAKRAVERVEIERMLAKSCRSADMRDYHKVKLGNDFRWRQAHNVKFAVGQEVSERIGLDKLISIYDGSKEVPFFV